MVALGTEQNSGWATEECLDTQWSYSMNPNATIQVVEAVSDSFPDLYQALQYATNPPPGSPLSKPNIISMSWGAAESSSQTSYEQYFSDTSICFFASSGDENYVNYPSSSPNVVACGGTSLTLNSDNLIENETTWKSGGCGPSILFPQPTYQQGIPNLSTYTNRTTADISAVANPYTGVLFVYNGETSVVGGTSVACPVNAGMISHGVAARLANNLSPLTTIEGAPNDIHAIFYNLTLNSELYPANFYDITQGTDGSYSASVNVDLPTGCGSINCTAIANTLENFGVEQN